MQTYHSPKVQLYGIKGSSSSAGSTSPSDPAPSTPETSTSVTYEVGDLFFSMNPTSPAERFGGEWEQLENKFIRAANNTDSGGNDSLTLTVSNMPSHRHSVYDNNSNKNYSKTNINYTTEVFPWVDSTARNLHQCTFMDAVGGSQPFNNMPVYQDVYVWQKVA